MKSLSRHALILLLKH